MHKVHRHYGRLTGNERFSLFLAAMARGDEEEAMALGSSCPKITYTQRDLEFHYRALAQREVMMVLYLEITKHLAALRLIQPAEKIANTLASDLAMCAFDSAIEAHWNAVDPGGNADSRALDDPRIPNTEQLMSGSVLRAQVMSENFAVMWDTPRRHALEGIAHWLARLDSFSSEEWGVSGDGAMRTMFELFDDLEPFREQVSAIEVVPDRRDGCYETLAALWKSTLTHVFPLPR